MRVPQRQQETRSQAAKERELIRKLHKRNGMNKDEIAKVVGKTPHAVAMTLSADRRLTQREIADLKSLVDIRGVEPVLAQIAKLSGERISLAGEIVCKTKERTPEADLGPEV